MRNKKVQNLEKELIAKLCLYFRWSKSWHKIWVHHILVLGRHQDPKPAKDFKERFTTKEYYIGRICATLGEINTPA